MEKQKLAVKFMSHRGYITSITVPIVDNETWIKCLMERTAAVQEYVKSIEKATYYDTVGNEMDVTADLKNDLQDYLKPIQAKVRPQVYVKYKYKDGSVDSVTFDDEYPLEESVFDTFRLHARVNFREVEDILDATYTDLSNSTTSIKASILTAFDDYKGKPTKILTKAKPELKEATKKDDGKLDWSLVPFEGLEEMVRVLEFGASKYSRGNFMSDGGMEHRRILNAACRHLFAYMKGEDIDPETGYSHIAALQCNALFLGVYRTDLEKFNKDNRDKR